MMKMKWFTFILACKKGLSSNGFIWFRPRCSQGSNGVFKHKPNTKFWCSYWLNFGSSFIFFFLQDSVSVQWFEMIFFFFYSFHVQTLVCGRENRTPTAVGFKYLFPVRTYRARVSQKHKYGTDSLLMSNLAAACATIQLKLPSSLQFQLIFFAQCVLLTCLSGWKDGCVSTQDYRLQHNTPELLIR